MVVIFPSDLVLPNGTLNRRHVVAAENIYAGNNGKIIERFTLETDSGRQSYIFKPLTHPDTVGREVRIHEKLLSRLTGFKSPKVLLAAAHLDPDRYWIIMEDFGALSHQLSEKDVAKAAGHIPFWHRMPRESLPDRYAGNKPGFEKVLATLRENRGKLERVILQLKIKPSYMDQLCKAVEHANSRDFAEKVVSHGDLHRGNVSVVQDEVIILDWEHAHLNSPFWDLFHLVDISHPHFRRIANENIRMSALDAYCRRRKSFGWEGPIKEFVLNYHLYAAIYSAWMLLLIEDDLKKGAWEAAELFAARRETCRSLLECLRFVYI